MIALLQEGKVGKTWHLVIRCYDEHNRTPADRKKALEDAYPAMLRLCDYDQFPGLLTSRTEVLVSNTEKESEGDSINMTVRFARDSDATKFVSECNEILRRNGFRA